MSRPLYMPFLKSKDAELGALAQLGLTELDHVLPMLELMPPGQRESSDHYRRVARQAKKGSQRYLVDDRRLNPSSRINGEPILSYFCDCAREEGIQVVPATGPNRESLAWIGDLIGQEGVAIRLSRGQFRQAPTLVQGVVDELGIARHDVDLILDLGNVDEIYDAAPDLADRALSTVPGIELYRTVTVAMGSFPISITNVRPGHGLVARTRREVEVFSIMADEDHGTSLVFGDYTVGNHALDDPNIEGLRSSANVRYATADEWLISRALLDAGHEAIYELCGELIGHPGYSGPGYSAADNWVNEKAQSHPTPGNAATWRQNWVVRHMVVTVRNLASPP